MSCQLSSESNESLACLFCIFNARRYAITAIAIVGMSVCLSVCPTHSWTLVKTAKRIITLFHQWVAPPF